MIADGSVACRREWLSWRRARGAVAPWRGLAWPPRLLRARPGGRPASWDFSGVIVVSFSSRHGNAIPGLADTPPAPGLGLVASLGRVLHFQETTCQIIESADVWYGPTGTCPLPIRTLLQRRSTSRPVPSRTAAAAHVYTVRPCSCTRSRS